MSRHFFLGRQENYACLPKFPAVWRRVNLSRRSKRSKRLAAANFKRGTGGNPSDNIQYQNAEEPLPLPWILFGNVDYPSHIFHSNLNSVGPASLGA